MRVKQQNRKDESSDGSMPVDVNFDGDVPNIDEVISSILFGFISTLNISRKIREYFSLETFYHLCVLFKWFLAGRNA